MKVNFIPWLDQAVRNDHFLWEDVRLMASFMQEMGHDTKLFNSIDLSIKLHGGDGLFSMQGGGSQEVYDCDLLFVHPMPPVRFGGKVTKFDKDSMQAIRNTNGKVLLFHNDSYMFGAMKNVARSKWGEYALDFPFIFASSNLANRTDQLGDTVKGLCGGRQITLNQTWTNGYDWIQKKGGVPRLDHVRPKADFFYGGVLRHNEFRKTFLGLTEEFGRESFWSYGAMAREYGLVDAVKENYGRSKVGRKELIELTSQCRFSLLPYDRNKDYITTKALENGMSNSLVLADERYATEGLKFETLNLQDVDAVRRYLEMDEDERLDLVDKQHKMLDAFDFKSKAKRQVDDLERLVMTGAYPEESV